MSWRDLPPLPSAYAQFLPLADPKLLEKLTLQQQQDLLAKTLLAEKVACEERYQCFFRSAWNVIEPETPLYWNWHIGYLCDELQKQVQRIEAKEPKEYDIVITISPRSLKSSLVSKLFNPWVWIQRPHLKFLTVSYSGDLSIEHAVASRRVIQSDWYRGYWKQSFTLTTDVNLKSFYENDKSGYRIATGLEGIATGRGGNIVIVDDPISIQDADSAVERANVVRWWTQTMPTRLNNRATDMFLIVMQRSNTEDLTGYILEYQKRRFLHICIPAEETNDVNPPELRKFYVNGLFFPDHPAFTTASLDQAKSDMGPYAYSGQMLQRPTPQEGGDFKRHYWKYWRNPGANLAPITWKLEDGSIYPSEVVVRPKLFDDTICSWDMAFKNKQTSDFVVGQVWGMKGADKYLLCQIRAKMSFSETCNAVKELRGLYPKTSGILIEDKANGPAVISELKTIVPGIVAVPAQGSKTSRAYPMARQCQAGNIYLPHKEDAPWIPDFIERFANFPNVAKDDEIDAASQAINQLSTMKRVWAGYTGETVKVNVEWGNLDSSTMLLCSEWITRKLESHLLIALWNRQLGRLAVMGEIYMDSLRPELMVTEATSLVRKLSRSVISNLKNFSWYGNDLMFSGETAGDIKEAYNKYGIYPIQNDKYDEHGAIVQVAQMRFWKKILISDNVQETSRQMASWCFEGRSAQREGFGFCYALCNLVGCLYRFGHMGNVEKPLKPYSKKKTEYRKRIESLAKSGDWIAIERGAHTPERGSSGTWIV